MDYERSRICDDDLAPSKTGHGYRGARVIGNGGTSSRRHYGQFTAEQHMRKLEQDAYKAVLQAFKAQSEHITWAKEKLMSNLRKELMISDEQHLKFLVEVGTNDALCQIRECRPQGDEYLCLPMYAPLLLDPPPNPGAATSWKKQKTVHVSQATFLLPALKPSPVQSPAAPEKWASPVSSRGKKSQGARQQQNVFTPTPKSISLGATSAGRGSALVTSGGSVLPGHVSIDPCIGRRVKTRRPADNAFYGVVPDCNPESISLGDLKVVNGPLLSVNAKDPSMNVPVGGHVTAGRGTKKAGGRKSFLSPGGRGKTASKGHINSSGKSAHSGIQLRNWKGSTPDNVLEMKGSQQNQFSSLDALIKEFDKIGADDLSKIESVKQAAKVHEKILRKSLAEVGETSEEGQSDEENHAPFSYSQSMHLERERRNRQDSREALLEDGGNVSPADDGHQADDE